MADLVWRKSSRSSGDRTACVEVALVWRKSSHSSGEGTECVEVALPPEATAIRDSKHPNGPILLVPRSTWSSLLDSIQRP